MDRTSTSADVARLAWEEAERRLPLPAALPARPFARTAAQPIEPAFAAAR